MAPERDGGAQRKLEGKRGLAQELLEPVPILQARKRAPTGDWLALLTFTAVLTVWCPPSSWTCLSYPTIPGSGL